MREGGDHPADTAPLRDTRIALFITVAADSSLADNFAMPTATLNGASIHFRDKGKGMPVLLLHGFPLSHRMWDAQVDALAVNDRAIAPDFRGFGQSTNPEGAFTIEKLADDVHALVQHLGLGAFVLGGLSMGGYVALAYAAKYPATLRGLMLFDTKAEGDSDEARQTRDKMIELTRRQGARPVATTMLGKLIPESSAEGRPQLVRDLKQMMESTNPETIAHALAAMRDRPDYTSTLGRIAVPTLIVVGEEDAITPPEVMTLLHEQIPQSVMQTIPSSGHMTPMEQPQLVTHAIEGYLGEVNKGYRPRDM